MADYTLGIYIAAGIAFVFMVTAELWKQGRLRGPIDSLNRRFSKDTTSETRRILKQQGARRNILLPNSYTPYDLDPEDGVSTKKYGTDDPIRVFRYWGPSNTLETVEVHDDEWVPEKTNEFLAGGLNTIRLLNKGGMTADQLRIKEKSEDLKIAVTALRNYEKRLGISAQDSITKSIFTNMKKRAEESAGGMKAAGRPRLPENQADPQAPDNSTSEGEEGDNGSTE